MNIREMHMIGPRCRERFLAVLEKGPLAELGVRLAGISDLQGRYYMSRPRPPVFILLGTLAGQAQLQTEIETRLLKPGDILMLPPNVPHRYDTLRNGRWKIIWFHFLPQAWMPALLSVRVIQSEMLSKLAGETEDILTETSLSSYLGVRARRAKETYVAVLIQRLLNRNQTGEQERCEKILHQLWRRVMEDLARPWTLPGLAALTGFSAGHLNRVCRRHYGRPVIKQLTIWRLEYASHILARGELKIDAIAGLCGYTNAFAFSVAFKRYFGCPPSRFGKEF